MGPTLGGFLGDRRGLGTFWALLGSLGDPLGSPVGTHFGFWTPPGVPLKGLGSQFKASWASLVSDPIFGPKKSPKKLDFEGVPDLEN